jgi:hypothetical protein
MGPSVSKNLNKTQNTTKPTLEVATNLNKTKITIKPTPEVATTKKGPKMLSGPSLRQAYAEMRRPPPGWRPGQPLVAAPRSNPKPPTRPRPKPPTRPSPKPPTSKPSAPKPDDATEADRVINGVECPGRDNIKCKYEINRFHPELNCEKYWSDKCDEECYNYRSCFEIKKNNVNKLDNSEKLFFPFGFLEHFDLRDQNNLERFRQILLWVVKHRIGSRDQSQSGATPWVSPESPAAPVAPVVPQVVPAAPVAPVVPQVVPAAPVVPQVVSWTSIANNDCSYFEGPTDVFCTDPYYGTSKDGTKATEVCPQCQSQSGATPWVPPESPAAPAVSWTSIANNDCSYFEGPTDWKCTDPFYGMSKDGTKATKVCSQCCNGPPPCLVEKMKWFSSSPEKRPGPGSYYAPPKPGDGSPRSTPNNPAWPPLPPTYAEAGGETAGDLLHRNSPDHDAGSFIKSKASKTYDYGKQMAANQKTGMSLLKHSFSSDASFQGVRDNVLKNIDDYKDKEKAAYDEKSLTMDPKKFAHMKSKELIRKKMNDKQMSDYVNNLTSIKNTAEQEVTKKIGAMFKDGFSEESAIDFAKELGLQAVELVLAAAGLGFLSGFLGFMLEEEEETEETVEKPDPLSAEEIADVVTQELEDMAQKTEAKGMFRDSLNI